MKKASDSRIGARIERHHRGMKETHTCDTHIQHREWVMKEAGWRREVEGEAKEGWRGREDIGRSHQGSASDRGK